MSGLCQKQCELKGKVLDANNEVLPFAKVFLNDSQKQMTDFNGTFSFSVDAGEHDLVVEHRYFETYKTKISVLENTELEIQLKATILDMPEVLVSVNAQKIREEQGYALNTIEIKEYKSQSVDVNDLLRRNSAISVRQEGGMGTRVNYALNGMGGRSVRFFFDGIPMDYFGTSFAPGNLPVSLVKRIEIYKGVIPAELGNDALGGAVNIVPHTLRKSGAEVSYSFGSFNTHQGSVLGYVHDTTSGFNASILAFYNYSDNNYEIWGDDVYVTNASTFEIERGIRTERFHDAFRSTSVKLDVGLTKRKWADQISVGVVGSLMDKEIQHGPTMEVTYGEAKYFQNTIIPYLTFKKRNIKKRIDLNLFSSYNVIAKQRVDTSRNIYNWYGEIDGYRTVGGEQKRTLNQLNEHVWLNRINAVYKLNSNQRIIINNVSSFLTRKENDPILTSKNDGYWAPQRLFKNVFGLSYKGELFTKKFKYSVFLKNFHYTAAIKTSEYLNGNLLFSNSTVTGNQMGYGTAISYSPNKQLTLLASIEKVARLPESDEILGDGLTVLYSDSLRPERSLNANLGLRYSFFQNKPNQLLWTTNLFYRDVTDLIQRYQYDLGSFVNVNFQKVEISGIDCSIEYRFKKALTVQYAFSYLNPIIKSKKDLQGNDNIAYDSRLPNTPFLMQNATASYSIENPFKQKGNLFIYWSASHIGKFYRYSESIGQFDKDFIPAQFVNSCGVGYQFFKDKMSVSFDARNIFDTQTFDNYAIQKPGRAFFAKLMFNI